MIELCYICMLRFSEMLLCIASKSFERLTLLMTPQSEKLGTIPKSGQIRQGRSLNRTKGHGLGQSKRLGIVPKEVDGIAREGGRRRVYRPWIKVCFLKFCV